MLKRTLVTLALLFASGALAIAGAKYAAPPLGTNVAVCEFDAGSPTGTQKNNVVTIQANGKYNYDDSWTFKSLEVSFTYNDPVAKTTRAGRTDTTTNESTLASPGTFAVIFTNVAPPVKDESIVVSAKLTVKKDGMIDKTALAPTGILMISKGL